MTDFIARYNEKIEAAQETKALALAEALDTYNARCVAIIAEWNAISGQADAVLRDEMIARAQAFVGATPPAPVVVEAPALEALAQPADSNVVTLQQPEPGDERGVSEAMQTAAE